jgi:hypothetical protein
MKCLRGFFCEKKAKKMRKASVHLAFFVGFVGLVTLLVFFITLPSVSLGALATTRTRAIKSNRLLPRCRV